MKVWIIWLTCSVQCWVILNLSNVFVALHHLGKLVGTDVNEGTAIRSSMFCKSLVSPGLVISVPESILSHLVSSTWTWVAVLASSDTSLPLRNCALAVLIDYIPFAERHQLQSFLAAADSVYGLGKLAHPTCEGSLLQLSLALISAACLYSPAEDISLIPQNVWRNIEAWSKTDSKLGDLEKKACQVLCRLRNEGDEAKQVLNEVLSSSSSRQSDPDFGSTRESILQVLANLTSVQSYFDIFSRKIDEEVLELEEAEMELDILQKEHSLQEDSKDVPQIPCQASPMKDVTRLRQIKDCIHSLEKSVLREDIVAGGKRKLLWDVPVRNTWKRQLYAKQNFCKNLIGRGQQKWKRRLKDNGRLHLSVLKPRSCATILIWRRRGKHKENSSENWNWLNRDYEHLDEIFLPLVTVVDQGKVS
ncbi:hypothetical protein I3760_Q020000 [Carya illinoinensis]|nr:hypothetical protein I3760_Q020000 [Carya illinoinensis]